jgi:hypothetical protein
MNLAFQIDQETWTITCQPQSAPRTLAALASALPMPLQLHTPKIAGSHIYWHAPFVEDVEGAVDVLAAQPGAFIYWPVRQFLEITFAPLQAETASITVLGHLDGGLAAVQALGTRLREGHGQRRFEGVLTAIGNASQVAQSDRPKIPFLADIADRRHVLWAACPPEIMQLLASRAIMHPAGPVFMAESEMRVLHETLWTLRERTKAGDDTGSIRYAAGLVLARAGGRLRDFCHLRETGALLTEIADHVGDATIDLMALIEEAILIAGRIGAWLDLTIPWFPINEAMRRAIPPLPAS